MRLWYRGDIVDEGPHHAPIVRKISSEGRALIQIGEDCTWVDASALRWTGGVVASRLPRTGRGWRKLGRAVADTFPSNLGPPPGGGGPHEDRHPAHHQPAA